MVFAILLGAVVASRATDAPKRVLVLHAYNYTFPATTIASEAARRRLLEGSQHAIEIEADFLDLARMPGEEHATRTANFLREKYSKMHFDLVLVVGTEGVPFIIKYRDVVGAGVPVVFVGGSAANYAAMQLPPDITGIMSGFDLDKMLELAERLQPNATRLVVMGGSGRADRGWQQATREAIEHRKRKFERAFRFDLTYDAMLAEVSRLPSDTIVLLLSVYADSAGRPLIPRDVAVAVAKASTAPVYAPFGTYLGTGIVGGYVETYESMGIAAGDMALEILSGKDPATLPPRINPGQAFRVDATAMKRFGLKQGNLPPDSIVMFREPGVWDEHRNLVLATLFVVGLQSLFLAGLLFQWHRRRQAELSLRESEERMTFTAASANIGLWQFNRATDELWATQHCRVLFGLARDTPLTRDTFLAAVHPDDRRIAVNALRGILPGERPAVTDLRVVLPAGQERWIRVRARAYRDGLGTSDQLSGIFVDITEQKSAAAEAELQRQEVTHLMRVSVLGELSGAIAHEVNQPLTAILSNAQAALYLLAQDIPDLAQVNEALQDIVKEDNRAGEVVRRLRALLKKGEPKSEPVNINELINMTIALLRNELISRRVTMEIDLADQLPAMTGDPIQLQQVLLNLIMNAMDAMASMPAAARCVTISTRANRARAIEVYVRDRGPGLKPTTGHKLFEPFYTTKDHGLGLGLAICSTIVQAHGGQINLANDEAGGARAAFWLPAQEDLMAAQ
ncbi:MAG: PAS domain-containing protein [Xanthobacteraceae bacterium]|nr:PAS domain-containing protein [Xanthobacteraceae bacterium]